ncbi:unnamed protein product [Adineta steineri]|uniref:Uncharacterized protein n=1 Tax=Adineta steineri TaxID=433720 RepID=A0A813ZWG7_9BILA|nr:unnamed protein product [Adineta steineri]CAF3555076.1 unnamed protein product [Adineta steineri]
MRLLSVVFSYFICVQIGVFAELSSSSCSLLRTATSITTIAPEIAQLLMRYYSALSSSSLPVPDEEHHHREKRFLFADKINKDSSSNTRGSMLEQIVANAFKDVDYTRVISLIINNNESMNKIRQNINGEAIIRVAMRNIDYEKLGSSLWYAAEAEFKLKDFTSSIINITRIDTIYEELITNRTLPEWLIKSIHPNINVQIGHQMFETFQNLTNKFIDIMNSSENLDNYLFNIIQQQVLIPLGTIIQRVKDDKPTTLDHLAEIILNNVNKVVMEKFTTTIKPMTLEETEENVSTTTMINTEVITDDDDVKILLYQCSIAINSIGQTARVLLKALEQLYCTSVWE